MVKRLIRIIAAFVISAALFAVAGLLLAQQLNSATDSVPGDGVVFSVEPGESLGAISTRLGEERLVRSELFLKMLSYVKRTQSSFQVGTYRIEPGMTSLDIHDLLVSGKELLVRVTIPEGWSASQIATRLESLGITDEGQFLDAVHSSALLEEYAIPADSAEGYLFPDTYLFPRDYPAERIVDVLIDRFFQKIRTVLGDTKIPTPIDFHNIVVLASIIEREYRDPDEARMMASVFYNRLDLRMRLQSCATVAYVITEELGLEYPEVLTYDDLEIESDYNTYWAHGLPPGPIANPGLTAIDAALFPAQSDYLFFVLKDTDAGKHVFSRSFDEHVYAKNLYLKKS